MHVWDHLGDVSRSRPELFGEVLCVARSDMGAERLHPRPVRGSAAGLPAPAPQNQEASISSPICKLVSKPALADPGFADQHEERAPA
jgi:hypothetical protein